MKFQFKCLWYFICRYILIFLSDYNFTKLLRFLNFFRLRIPFYTLNIKNPKTFSDHINLLKFQFTNNIYTICADKLECRDYVASVYNESILVPLIAKYNSIEEVDFENLPIKFVMKCNHGSGMNLVCKDKNFIDWDREKIKLSKWLKQNYFYFSREPHYKNIPPKLICEKYLSDNVIDYKFFCFNGEPKIVQVDKDRSFNHRRTLFDLDWMDTGLYIRYKKIEDFLPKPVNFDLMIEITKKLSKPFSFVRIDLYEVDNQVFFGEFTFFPGSGVEPFLTYEQDLLAGKLFSL